MTTTAVQTQQTRAVDPAQSLAQILTDAAPDMQRIAPKYVNVQRLISLAIEVRQRNETLAKCSPLSVLNFCKKCAEWGSDRIGAGGVWPVPFWNKKANCFDMTPIPDWRLLVEKAKRAKAIKHCTAEVVLETDVFEYERGLDPKLVHRPTQRLARGKPVAVYVVYVLPDGTKDFQVVDWEAEIIPIRNRSKAWQSFLDKGFECPWNTDEIEMGKKTAIKKVMKLFEGASIELTSMIESDNFVNGYIDVESAIRAPISMPKELPAPAPESTAPAPGASQQDNQSQGTEGNQAGASVVTGLVEDVAVKPGTKKNGDKYTRYGVKVGGTVYGTFSDSDGETAIKAQKDGVKVEITWAQEGKYTNLTGITVLGDLAPPADDQEPKDDLPFDSREELTAKIAAKIKEMPTGPVSRALKQYNATRDDWPNLDTPSLKGLEAILSE